MSDWNYPHPSGKPGAGTGGHHRLQARDDVVHPGVEGVVEVGDDGAEPWHGRMVADNLSGMPRFRHHLFICENRRAEDAPRGSCAARAARRSGQAFKAELARRGLSAEIRANGAGCLDLCEQGPVVVVYPEGTWYVGVRPEDVAEIVEQHLVGGGRWSGSCGRGTFQRPGARAAGASAAGALS